MREKFALLLLLSSFLSITLHGQTIAGAGTRASGNAAAKQSILAQSKVTDCVSAQQLLWHGGTTLNYSSDGLEIHGSDAKGLPWKTIVPASGVMKCEVWSARLGPGSADALLVLSYGNSGSGYDNELTILFWDEQGRPIPWEANGGFTLTSRGIAQLTRTDEHGSARIVLPLREGDKHEGYVYVKQLYLVNGDRISKFIGREGDTTWPVITGNHAALNGNELNDAGSLELRTPQPGRGDAPGGYISVLKQPSGNNSGAELLLSNGARIAVPHIVVTDDPFAGRQIFLAEFTPEGVQKIIDGKYVVALEGESCEEEECRPLILWGSKERD